MWGVEATIFLLWRFAHRFNIVRCVAEAILGILKATDRFVFSGNREPSKSSTSMISFFCEESFRRLEVPNVGKHQTSTRLAGQVKVLLCASHLEHLCSRPGGK